MDGLINLNSSVEDILIESSLLLFFLLSLYLYYKLVKTRQLLVDVSGLLKTKNERISQLEDKANSITNSNEKDDLRRSLTHLLRIDQNSPNQDILYLVTSMMQSDQSSDSTLSTIKEQWLIEISNGNTEQVLKDLHEYLKTNKKDEDLFKLVGMSTRHQSLLRLMNQGIIKLEEFNIESNKLNSSILNFIKTLWLKNLFMECHPDSFAISLTGPVTKAFISGCLHFPFSYSVNSMRQFSLVPKV